jgi:DNA-directed RNA polymerase specialized sigma24 family protein
LAGLPDDVRSALELAVVGGLGYREIARRIGEREEAVVQRLRDGLSHLHQELGAGLAL